MNNDPLKGLRGEAETIAALELENQSLTRRLEEVEKERDAYRSEVVSVINHLPSNCIVHAADLPAQQSDCTTLTASVAKLAAKLTALRTAAERIGKALEIFVGLPAQPHGDPNSWIFCVEVIPRYFSEATAALAALRAELEGER